MRTGVIYARYSSDSQTEQSIEGQIRVCREYAERNNIIIAETYIDRAMTGTNDKRTDFQRMLKDSNKRAWECVLVYKLDRFSRNKYEMAMHKKTLRDNGIKLVSCMENIPDTPEGIILESLLEGMAEYYSAELSQKVKRGMNESRQKGNFTGGYVLYGYRVVNKKVEINEDEAEIVRWMFSECAAGKLVTDIIKQLREKGIMHRGKPFARNTIYQMLANGKYNGKYVYKNQVFTNIYPKIVPDEVFELVRTKIANNKYGKHKPEVCYVLKNKVKCGYCGKPVNSDAGTARNGTVMRYYKCSGKRIDKSCPLAPIRKETLEDLVVQTLLDALKSSQDIHKLVDKVFELSKEKLQENAELNLLTNEYTKTEKAINNILDCMEQGISTESTKQRLVDLENKKTLLNEQILLTKAKTQLQLNKEDVYDYIFKAIRKKPLQMIDLLIKEIRLYNDKIEIQFNYTDRKSPDENTRRDFCFYSCTKTYTTDTHTFNSSPISHKVEIYLYI